MIILDLKEVLNLKMENQSLKQRVVNGLKTAGTITGVLVPLTLAGCAKKELTKGAFSGHNGIGYCNLVGLGDGKYIPEDIDGDGHTDLVRRWSLGGQMDVMFATPEYLGEYGRGYDTTALDQEAVELLDQGVIAANNIAYKLYTLRQTQESSR